MEPEVLAFKVLLWQGRADKRHPPTRGSVLEAVEIKAKEWRVTDKKTIEKAGQIVLSKLNLLR